MGYTGGKRQDPTYKTVCSGDGHTAALQINYDPGVITYEELMHLVLRQACAGKAKPQYMSAVWTETAEEAEIARKVAASCGKSAVPILKATTFHPAEEYHQKYVEKSRRR